jgi:competence ComEA-like helix-hairpin-helix protein
MMKTRCFLHSAFIIPHSAFPSVLVNYLSFRVLLLDNVSTSFPQFLWKTLWISRFFALQVPENFRLLAFCTLLRQTLQTLCGEQLSSVKRILFTKSFVRIILCCAFVAASVACVKLPRRNALSVEQFTTPASDTEHTPHTEHTSQISINRATREQLETLPGIGPALAARIIEQRTRYGPFRRVEHILLVRGISVRGFRQLRPLINVE